jgi:putative phosphoesterase
LGPVVRALVLADTHVGPGTKRQLPDQVWAAMREADVVLHAGDVVDEATLEAIASHKPLHAVLGNNDHALRQVLPDRLELVLGGTAVAMVHETGTTAGRARRVRRWFPEARVVIFGHSHMPCNEWVDGQLLFNPGSSTWKRTAPAHTYGVLEFARGEITRHEIMAVAAPQSSA